MTINEFFWKHAYQEVKPLFEDLKEYRYALIKGDALSIQAYGKVGKRQYGDLDVLVERQDVMEIEEILRKHGFVCNNDSESSATRRKDKIMSMVRSHQLPSFFKESKWGKIELDLNFDIYWGQYLGEKESIGSLLDSVRTEQIYGCEVKVLSPEHALLQLVLHHYKEMNSIYHLSNFYTIKSDMFRDVLELIKNRKNEIQADSFYEVCEKYHVTEYAYYVLYYTKECFGENLLDEYITKLQSDRGIELLDKYGLDEDEQNVWKIPFHERVDNPVLKNIVVANLSPKEQRKNEINKKVYGNGRNQRTESIGENRLSWV